MTRTNAMLPGLLLMGAGCPGSSGVAEGGTGAGSGNPSTGNLTTPVTEDGPTSVAPGTETSDPDDSSGGSETGTGTGSSGGSTDSTSDDGGSSSTGPALEEIDCATVPTTAVSNDLIPNARGYHGLVITPDGMIIGSDGASLIQSDYDGNASVFAPGVGGGQQMDWLLDGDFVWNDGNGALSRVGLDATISTIVPNVGAYGATTGVDGMVYIVRDFAVERIDPDDGTRTHLFDAPDPTGARFGFGIQPHSMAFSPDNSRAYFGTIGLGDVFYADFDGDMQPISAELELFASGVGNGGGWHDAVAVDACGNLYIPDFYSANMYRVTPGGDVNLWWDPTNDDHYAHGAVWGTGEHGWKADALYVPQPYNGYTVREVVVGVPSRTYAGPVINAEPMSK